MSKQKNGSEIQTKDISVVGTVSGAMDYRQSIPIRSLLRSVTPIQAVLRGGCLLLLFGTLAFNAGCKGCKTDNEVTENVSGESKQSKVQEKENKKAKQDAEDLEIKAQ